jgi:hypothetical protein
MGKRPCFFGLGQVVLAWLSDRQKNYGGPG